ncbi:uncharacterized protein LOC127738139 [Mytilus californianus]|uniref:uncharacterized protein LOC127738139 n=1 Tax=Mytilus californianus TaxID=6549 RepID=UPI002245E02C|nr:uncharacterized protein LOC127738139 [Mytilus californianus]XP_052105231.1 uncharacterized protein LOC127738139 [Mytilus californianus]XP_052105232.1 uncharacterized protein LOC127738139 [Mytilus californianus]XP_052105233.1 uncharacterized protein LOC127738139 [Mytilus californianus]
MFKRKNPTESDEPAEKRSRLSDEAVTEDDGEIDITEENTSLQDTSTNQSPSSSSFKSILGKFIPNLSWRKTGDSPIVTEKGDNSIEDESSSGSRSNRNSLSPRKASSAFTNCKGTVALEGKIKLKNKWIDDLLDPSTEEYQTLSQNFVKEIDELLHNSNVSKVYMNVVVIKYSNIQNTTRSTRKSPGNIMVHSEMTFHHTYTKLFKDLSELCDNVEDFIILQSSLGETADTSLQIDDGADSVNINQKEEKTIEAAEEEDMSQNGHTEVAADEEVTEEKFVDAEQIVSNNADEMRTEDSNDVTEEQMLDVQQETETNSKQVKTSSGVENKVDGREISITESMDASGASAEGEEIIIGKAKIPDVVSEETDSKVSKAEAMEKTPVVKKNKRTPEKKDKPKSKIDKTKQESSREDQPSGSGLQSKSPKETKTPEQKDDGEFDNDSVPSDPSVPQSVATTSNSITLKWNRPKRGVKSVDHYEIKYKECKKGKGKWISVLSEGAERTVKVKDLKAETKYEFKVRAVNEDGEEGPFCLPIKLSTVSSLARSLIPLAKKTGKGHPVVYKLPLIKNVDTVNEQAKTRKCVFGSASENVPGREKTIMVIGATGSGKTTLVDGMINYITDVSWEDEFRFSMVDLTDDEKKRKASEAESQTEWITCYTINKMEGSTIDYTLNIIDTPGFGDTRGIVRDKRIVDQIREFFTTPGRQGITCLDAVCFVTQAPLGKLTPPQRYIFDQILSVFGQDIKSNIFILITFADANEPPVRAALKAADVPYQKSYKFNNSALYASPENPAEAEMGNLFWKMGRENFKIFFDELRTVESKSLLLTSEVLQLRKRLETTIQGLQQQIADGMNKLNTIKQEKEILKRHKEDIKAKKDFTYEVDEVHMYQIDLDPGVYVTNCMACNRTCHFPCGIPDDKNKQNCAAIDDQKCTICPMHCHWTIHKNNPFRFDTYTMKVIKTYDELKKKYEVAQKEAQKHKCVLGKVKTAFTTLGQDVMKMVHEVRCYINKLNDIALRPNPLSDKDYIDLLIESEKSEKKYGWDKRINLYYKLREEAELLEQMNQQNYQPWTYIDSDESEEDDEKTDDSQDNTDDEEKTDDSQDNADGSTADDEDYKPKDLPLYQEPDMDME